MFRDYFLNTDVLSIACYSNYVLAGIGSDLFIYDGNKFVTREKVFNGERIHNIQIHEDCILLKGCKELSVVKIFEDSKKPNCQIVLKIKCKDWITDVFCDLKNKNLVLSTAHNVIQVWDTESACCIESYVCEEKCLLYSSKFIGKDIENYVLLCGTVFSEVLVWAPLLPSFNDQQVLQRLPGHDGVIFSITADPDQKIICSTSDDRSVRIWKINTEGSILERQSWEKAKVSLIHTLYSHTARVWKSLILPNFVISAGEDSKLCLWSKSGLLENTFDLHQESGIRGLAHCPENGSVITGGEDGGIIILLPDRFKFQALSSGYYNLNNHEFGFPRKIIFLDGVVSITDKGCVMHGRDESKMTKIYDNKEFSSYCLVEISKCNKYLMLGSIRGRIVIIELKSRTVCYDENIIGDRIYSFHWLEDRIVICTSGGKITVYEVELSPKLELIKKNSFALPKSKEMWITCCLIYNDSLVVGDRIGSLHVYSMKSSETNPKQSFFKLHGYLGVTDIARKDKTILTSGRDGSVKEFAIGDDSLTFCMKFKLPMDWPWRIILRDGKIFIIGFSSVFFVIWNLEKRETVSKYDCGGGHRSCDFTIIEDALKFFYISDKKINFVRLPLFSMFHLRSGFHGKEINCFKIVSENPLIAISGSEDTTLRISRLGKDDLKELYVLRNHISNVRDLTWAPVSDGVKILFSGGGRGQISVHKFDVDSLKYEELENLFLNSSDKKGSVPSMSGETRVMCVDLAPNGNGLLLAAACSDRQIRIFSYRSRLAQLSSIPYSHCLLKVKFMSTGSRLVLLSMGTDGRVAFFDVTQVNSRPDSVTEIDTIRVHQSGINSCELKQLDGKRFVLATGGDDNLLSVMLFKLDAEPDCKVDILSKWESSSAHSCQITGMKILDDLLLTTSVDQRLILWSFTIEVDNVAVTFIQQYLSVIADMQGMEIAETEDGSLLVCLFGKGLEIVQVDLSKIRNWFEQITQRLECGEGPHWDSSRQCLYMVDINSSLVLRYDYATKKVYQAKVDGPYVSFIIPVKDTKDKFLIGVGRDLVVITWDGVKDRITKKEMEIVCSVEGEKPNNRFNDGKCDAKGRVLSGTMGACINGEWEPKRGSLYSIGKDRVPRMIVANDIGISNGLAWSLDNKTFYYIDSLAYRIDAFDYNLETGAASNRRVLFDLKSNGIEGLPDGMCIDANGNLWVTLYEGGLMCLNPTTKQVIHKFTLPGCHITSAAFGGKNLDELYVTSACQFMTAEERKTNPFFGCTFKITGLGAKGFDGIPVVL